MQFKSFFKRQWLITRYPLFVVDIVLVILAILLYQYDTAQFKALVYSPAVLLILLLLVIVHVYPPLLNGLVARYCNKRTADAVVPISEDINKIKADIKKDSVKNVETKSVVTNILKKESDSDVGDLIADLKEKRFDKVMLRVRDKIKKGGGIVYNIVLELAYGAQDISNYDIKDRINNLATIIRENAPMTVKMAFIIQYISCNLYIDEHALVEQATYKAINLARKSEIDPVFLCKLYRIQMDSFTIQNRISEAIASGKKALEYADAKDRCIIYFSLSKIYFYFLNNNKCGLENALSAWNDIYKDAPFMKELVQLCYITLFFDGHVTEACDFLLNFTDNEKDDSYKDNLSYLLYKKGDIKSAQNNANYCVKQNPKEAIASLNTIAMIEKDAGHYEQALYYFSEAITGLEPNSQVKLMKYFWLEAIYNRAVCYIKLGNFEKAKPDMDFLIKEQYADMDSEILKEYYELDPAHIVSE